MSESLLRHPAEPVEDTEESSAYGGFAEIARRWNALHPERPIPVSRQLVHKLWKNRGTNHFPEARLVEIDGKTQSAFDLDEAERWYADRELKRGGVPPIDTIPLFQLDHRGHPVDSEQSSYRGHPETRERYRGSILDY